MSSAVFGRSLFINHKDYHFRGKTTIHPLGDVSDFFRELELFKFIFAKQIWQPQVANCDCRAWRHLKAIKARGARYLRCVCVCLGGVPSSRIHGFFKIYSFYQIAPGTRISSPAPGIKATPGISAKVSAPFHNNHHLSIFSITCSFALHCSK